MDFVRIQPVVYILTRTQPVGYARTHTQPVGYARTHTSQKLISKILKVVQLHNS